MEEIRSESSFPNTTHQAPILLVGRIIVTELLIMLAHYFSRILLKQIENSTGWSVPLSVFTLEVIVLQVANLYLIINVILKWINLTYTFNPKEVIIRQGVFSTKATTYEFANLQSMTVTQNIVQKLFHFGTIKLFNPVLKEDVHIVDIPNPYIYANFIQQYQPEVTPLIKKQNNR